MMAHSVEGRLPFLDHRIVELCAEMPPGLRMNVLDEKYILKRIAKPFLPASITARTKQAYRAPDSASFFGTDQPEYIEELLSEKNVNETGYFNYRAVSALVNKCKKAGSTLMSTKENIAIVSIITTLLVDRLFVQKKDLSLIKN